MMEKYDLKRIIDHGFHYGHQHNPKYPDLEGFTPSGLLTLPSDHRLVTEMVQSVQESDGNLDQFARQFHKRDAVRDGDAGPATLALVDLPRCSYPDFAPAQSEEELRSSWPKGCVAEFPNLYCIVMSLEVSRMQTMWKDNLDFLTAAITKAQNEIGYHILWRQDHSGQAHMKISWRVIGGNTIGFNSVPNSFSCGMSITGSIDTSYSPSTLTRLGRLGMHEWMGHGFGFGHYSETSSQKSIMNPSITDGNISWIGDRLYDDMLALADGPITPGGDLGDWGYGTWL